MKNLDEVIAIVPGLSRTDLDRWIQAALIEADQDADRPALNETQVARVRLVCSLRYDMEVEEETLPVVLDLIDQLHAARARLHRLSQAVLAQDEEVRAAVLEIMAETRRGR
ncbi:MAG: chaperone modulator CbpM [Hoeflea sp.]|uniref:chaperone modulator CbpM n=1 Tax=Hoeflea sp. TaxID=1940281 RepID=UPI00272FC765|nr:chaperone modulator CbpM [Hoeflea sp.]MDP2120056.1 chaperone modulator CbpM [Hoeflea sp.]MDP3525829.1 chaperone modulator CbpM [Hoeflea sp.]